ncbi:MAG: sigma-70 family RNA polymerase sigma factor [Planctomycetota bacterium]
MPEPRPHDDDARRPDARALSSRIAAGDEDAFTRFYESWRPFVAGLARKALTEGADDVTQEVFMRVIRGMPVLDSDRAVGAWLTTATRRCVVDALRARERARRNDALGRERASGVTEGDLESAMRLLEESEGELRALIEARVRFGWTLERIGRAFGLTPSAVDGRIKRALRSMRDAMSERSEA